ncbi:MULTISPECIES: hypothetical protein [unclassified Mesorhizobium]|uniref:hypothetical protein n=1 Tax=unclassified Mesorhizobium TaxID=325217 RepID=UPI0019D29594|nr:MULTISPECIES: hypothetical protein [unclassified Mesorhizobium]
MSIDNPAPRPAGLSGFGLADWLCLAAAPTFVVMALLTAADSGPDAMCMSGPGASVLSGMAPMYFLMAALHLAPWLRLLARGVAESALQPADELPDLSAERMAESRDAGV